MGNSPSYAKLATIRWYAEGKRLYGCQGFIDNASTWHPTVASFPDSHQGVMKGKLVLVTGANQGIGYAAAEQCGLLGADVVLLCRDEGRGKAAADQLRPGIERAGGTVRNLQLDVSDFAAVRAFVGALPEALGVSSSGRKIDVLINNAGCMPAARTLSRQGHDMIVATAVGGAHLLTTLVLPLMSARGDSSFPRVVIVSSGGQYTVAPRVGDLDLPELADSYDATLVYAYAKRWQVQLARSLAEAFPDVGIFSVHPGWVSTEGVRSAMPGFHEQQKESLRGLSQGADSLTFLACAPAHVLREAAGLTADAGIPGAGCFWFDRAVVPFDMAWCGTAWTLEQRAELTAALDAYTGLHP